jgi:DNA-binding response OmpR family regulator
MAATVRTLSLRDGVVDFVRREIRFDDGERNPMSQLEAALLHHLAANAGRVISRDEILSQVWRLNPARVITRTIDMHVSNLRRKLRDDPQHPVILFTVNRGGYVLDTDGKP